MLLAICLVMVVWSAIGLLLLAAHSGPRDLARTATALSAFAVAVASLAFLLR